MGYINDEWVIMDLNGGSSSAMITGGVINSAPVGSKGRKNMLGFGGALCSDTPKSEGTYELLARCTGLWFLWRESLAFDISIKRVCCGNPLAFMKIIEKRGGIPDHLRAMRPSLLKGPSRFVIFSLAFWMLFFQEFPQRFRTYGLATSDPLALKWVAGHQRRKKFLLGLVPSGKVRTRAKKSPI